MPSTPKEQKEIRLNQTRSDHRSKPPAPQEMGQEWEQPARKQQEEQGPGLPNETHSPI